MNVRIINFCGFTIKDLLKNHKGYNFIFIPEELLTNTGKITFNYRMVGLTIRQLSTLNFYLSLYWNVVV